jgi:hypothetical protein
MSRVSPPFFADRLVSLFLPDRDREMLTGDLYEEHALLVASQGANAATRWYWRQVLRSAGPLFWANLRRGVWLKTMGAMFGGYVAMASLVMAGDALLSQVVSAGDGIYPWLSLTTGIPAMLLGGYLAAWMRPRAAVALAVFAAVMGIISLIVTGDRAPLWYQLALIILGPLASLAGGRIRNRQKEGSRL